MVLKKNWLLCLVAFIVFSGLLIRYLDRVPIRHYCDFRVYYKAGQDLIQGKNIYFREKEEITPYKYSPFFALVFAPLSMLPIKISASVFFAINYLSTILFFWLTFRLLADSPFVISLCDRDRFLVFLAAGLCSLRYIFLVWDSGQVNIIMGVLVLIGLVLMSQERDFLAGAFFAAAILIKYTPAIFLFYLLVKRQYKAVLGAVFFIVLFLTLPVLVVGIKKDIFYLSTWIPYITATSLDRISYLDLKNQSIFSMILRFFSPTEYNVNFFAFSFDQALLIGRVAALLIYAAVFLPGKARSRDFILDSAILMICISLFNPNGWLLNFVSLVPAYMLLIQYLWADKARDRIVFFALIAAFVLTNLLSKDILGKALQNFSDQYSFTTMGALVLYAALLKLKFFQRTQETIS